MDTLNRIIELLNRQNRQQKELTDFLGLEKSSFSAWKNGTSASYKKYLPEIANFFGISIDHLVGRKTEKRPKSPPTTDFSRRLQKLRTTQNISQETLARDLNVSKGAVAMWETGKRKPDMDMLKTIAAYFGVTVDDLIGVDNDKPQYEKFAQLLQERNITAYRVSKETGITQTTLSDWKTGRAAPKASTLQKIAKYFDVSLDWFFIEHPVSTTNNVVKSLCVRLEKIENDDIKANICEIMSRILDLYDNCPTHK